MASIRYRSLRTPTMTTWGNTLSLGERSVTMTLPQLSAFLRKIATAHSQSAQRLRAAMLACVERGTARGVAERQIGFRLAGKTGTGPEAARPHDGIFAGLIFVRDEPRYTVVVYLDGKGAGGGAAASMAADLAASLVPHSCFILDEIGRGEIRREGDGCAVRVPPASTFKIAHALAALDAGVVDAPDSKFAYDGSLQPFESWRRDQTLATAMRNSVVWVFQRIASQLGVEREREYLRKLSYGMGDPSPSLTTFWLDGSLSISPEEQRDFLLRLYRGELSLKRSAVEIVRQILVQPKDVVVDTRGEHPFPSGDAVVSAKTGGVPGVRWLVGHVRRGDHACVFVSCVTGVNDADAAITLAAAGLRREGVL
jgi:beta-lactamase class D